MTGFKRPRKRFGQNFLIDESIVQRIVTSVDADANDELIEIGPGRGALTSALLQTGVNLTAIEIDRDLVPRLEQQYRSVANFSVLQADALQLDFTSLAQQRKIRLVGNLPYNIATPLIFHLLESIDSIVDMHFMLQWEVVARLAASCGDPQYGQLSILIQNLCHVTSLFQVPPQAFNPAPKVMSGVVRLVPRAQPQVAIEQTAHFSRLVKSSFAQRRKTLRNNLKAIVSDEAFEQADVNPGMRAEQLTLDDFARLSQATLR